MLNPGFCHKFHFRRNFRLRCKLRCISWVVWFVVTLWVFIYSLVWCVGSGVLLVGCCVLERNLPASVIDILFSYAYLMTRFLLAKMGQAAVPAAWSGFPHVGHFDLFFHRLFNSWALAQYLHFGMLEHRSSGCSKVQHLWHNDGLGMYFFRIFGIFREWW